MVTALLYIVVAGFAVAAVCGYMAGLVGSSNSPVSGLAILAVLGAALLLAAVAKPMLHGGDTKPLVAFALLVTSILLAVAVSANDNLQDLKTGQLVGGTPWRQQVALVIGVIAGSAVIPPILVVLNKAQGFASVTGVATGPNNLGAPQAHADRQSGRRCPHPGRTGLGPDRHRRSDRRGLCGGGRIAA